MGTCARLGSRWARLPHADLAGDCALGVVFLCKSCFIRDIDLCGPMAWFLALHAWRAVCEATRRVLGTADSGRHTPDDRGVRVWRVQNAKSRFMLPMHSMGGTWSNGAWVSHGKECPR